MTDTSPSKTVYYLYEYDRGIKYGPASEEDCAAYTKTLQEGKTFINKGHHGFSLRMIVRKDNPAEA